jgi:tRNA G18 (ribose-2'-O)-methylase SpoU
MPSNSIPGNQFYILAHNVRSMHNVGAIFRTSDGAGVDKIFLTGYTATPPRVEITKSALGAETWIPWEYDRDPFKIISRLKQDEVSLVALEQTKDAVEISGFNPDFPLCLVVGNEINGVPDQILAECDTVVQLPMRGKKESLNVSVAFGIAAYEIAKHRDSNG